LIGRDHEIFDQVARAIPSGNCEIDDFAVRDDGRRFHALEVERTGFLPRLSQSLRSFILQF
jgi:hypothetical protein